MILKKKEPTHTLDHKFVFYSTVSANHEVYLPPTSDEGMVFLYLEAGTSSKLAGNQGQDYNYVIFSKDDIAEIYQLRLKGTMIMETGTELLRAQGGTHLEFDEEVVSAIVQAGLIRENPDYTKLVDPTADPAAAGVANAGTDDAYYVSTAPQLNISLESRYKNKEIDPATLDESKRTDIQASLLVMPRVIYVTQDLVGKLSDYYNVLRLNKAVYNGDGSVSCSPGGLNPTMTYDGKTMVPEDIYTCKYEATTYADNPFYVVVKGKMGKVPAVTFETPNLAKINAGGASATVNMLVKQATGSATMNVGVNVYGLPESWSLTPQTGVSAQSVGSGVDGQRSYLVSFKANEAKKPLFKISAPSNAEAATVHFELAEPLSGCTIGTPSSFDVTLSGSVTIDRVVVPPAYCEGHTTITASDNTEYNCSSVTSPDWPNCGKMQTGIWVYPYCNSMNTITDNNSWTCGTNYFIHLLKNNISSNCLAFIPDTSLDAQNGETYKLYASLKRKPYKLYVKVKPESIKNNVTTEISIKDAADDAAQYRVISSSSTTNDGYKVYQVYSNYKVKAEVKNYGTNRFRYWGCASSGDDCIDHLVDDDPVAEYLISGVDTLTAHFNERDDHCFYDSFGEMKNSKGANETFKAFCSEVSWGRETCDAKCKAYENCVDHCETKDHCSVKNEEGFDPEANWMVVYKNHKSSFSCGYYDFAPPDYNDGFISAPGDGLFARLLRNCYSPTVLLHRVKAGLDGKMSLQMKVPSGITEGLNTLFGDGDNLNDGLILRSDVSASKYLSVTLDRGDLSDGQVGGAVARVCYVTGQNNNGNDCITASLRNILNGSYVILNRLTDVTMTVTLEGSSLKVNLDYNTNYIDAGSHHAGAVEFDLTQLSNTSLSYGADGYEYVGLKMYNRFYEYKDISWASETYSNACFDTPRIYCSFANKFLGGVVPKDSNVTPWVGMSSWFSGNSSCNAMEFYYNGCDMSNSLYSKNFKYLKHSLDCSDINGKIGGFWGKGSKLNGSVYNFEDEGYHKIDTSRTLFGDLKLSGYAKNASVEIVCGNKTYSSDCGRFYVGEIVPCSKHERSFEQEKHCNLDTCYVSMPQDKYANLRDAKVSMNISGLNETSVKAYLVDQNDVVSNPYLISADGTHEFDVNQIVGKTGFDPQNVKSVKFEGTPGYTVSGLQSYCSNAPGVFGCTASFDGYGFVINSTITNSIKAANGGCSVSNNEHLIDSLEQDCPANGMFYLSADEVYSDFGDDVSKDYSFTITMTDKQNVETSCQTNTVTVKKTTMSCRVDDAEIDAGENLSAFTYYLENCPAGGCNATVELYGKNGELLDEQSVLYNKNCTENISCEAQNWTPLGVNTAAGTYTYLLKYSTLPLCSASVTVNAVTPAKASECKVENGVFTAKITAPSSGAALAKLWYGDLLGNMIGSEKTISEYTNYSQEVNLGDGSYTLVLTLNGESACTVAYPDGGSSSGESGNGSDNQNSGDNSGENSGDNSGGNSGDNSSQNNSSSVSATCSYTTDETTGSVSYTISSVSGCDNNDCSIVVKRGDVDANMGSTSLGNTGMSSSPIDQNGTYTVYLNGSAMDNCTFTVTMVENNNSGDNNNGNGNNDNPSSGDITLSSTFRSYTAGTYTLKTGDLGNNNRTFHCDVTTTAVDNRTIGTLDETCTIVIPGYNNRSNGRGCAMENNTTYTFVVSSDVPADLTCGLAD